MALSIRPAACLFACLFACTDRPIGDTDTGSGDTTAGTTSPSSTSTSTTPTTGQPPLPTTGPDTTPPSDTTSSSSDPTTAAVTTTGPDSTTSDPGTTDVPKLDLPPQPAPLPDGIGNDCPDEFPGGTKIVGETPFGSFASTRAYFGFQNFSGHAGDLHLLFLDDSADLVTARFELEQTGHIELGPGAESTPPHKFTDSNQFWQGSELATVTMVAGGQFSELLVQVTVDGPLGSWDVVNPDDPPRLHGSVAAATDEFPFDGPFDAVYCDFMTEFIIVE